MKGELSDNLIAGWHGDLPFANYLHRSAWSKKTKRLLKTGVCITATVGTINEETTKQVALCVLMKGAKEKINDEFGR